MTSQQSASERRIDPARLEALVAAMLGKVGVPDEDARLVAQALVAADMRGMNSHGMIRLPVYIDRLKAGGFKADTHGHIVRQTDSTMLLDGENGLGAVLTCRAMDEAMAMARETGIGAVGIFNSNHNGEGAFYVLRAIRSGMIGIATTNGSPIMPGWGGKTKITGPLPITVGAPAGKELPVVLDMALGVSSRGKILYRAEKGMTLPDGWLVDSEGRPTNDPNQIKKGGWILPIGGYKGWGLMVAVEILTGVLTGGKLGREIAELYGDASKPQGNGHFVIAIDVAAFMDLDLFRERMDGYIRSIKASELQPGFEEVIVPGEPEFRKEAEQREHGLLLEPKVIDQVVSTARSLGLEPDL